VVESKQQQSSAAAGTTFSLFKMTKFYFTDFTLKNIFCRTFFRYSDALRLHGGTVNHLFI
jgi:hypothetical protein